MRKPSQKKIFIPKQEAKVVGREGMGRDGSRVKLLLGAVCDVPVPSTLFMARHKLQQTPVLLLLP